MWSVGCVEIRSIYVEVNVHFHDSKYCMYIVYYLNISELLMRHNNLQSCDYPDNKVIFGLQKKRKKVRNFPLLVAEI